MKRADLSPTMQRVYDALPDDELRENAESLKQQIDRLGPVNPLALEEYEQEKQRSDFLEKQVGDLRSAKTQLQETIDDKDYLLFVFLHLLKCHTYRYHHFHF